MKRGGVDPEKKTIIEEVARRYLAGESMEKLAAEHGVNHASIHKALMLRRGPEWKVVFRLDGVVVRDKPLVVPIAVPRTALWCTAWATSAVILSNWRRWGTWNQSSWR